LAAYHICVDARSSPVQVDAGAPEQRIGGAPQIADQRPDPPGLDQPTAAARPELAVWTGERLRERFQVNPRPSPTER